MDGGGAQDLKVGHPTALQRPHLPVALDALQLAVATDGHPASGIDDFFGRSSQALKDVFFFSEPRVAAAGFEVKHVLRDEPFQLGVPVDIGGFVEVVFGPRAAVGDEQRRGVGDAGF